MGNFRREIRLSGWEGALPPWPSLRVRRFPVEKVDIALRDPTASFVLVLGDLALALLNARRIAELIRGTQCIGAAVARSCPDDVLEPWRGETRLGLVSPGHLRDWVEREARRPLSLASSSDLPKRPGRDAAEAARLTALIDRLRCRRTQRWADVAGLSRWALRRRSIRVTGRSPSDILDELTAMEIAAQAAKGRTQEAIAAVIGVSDGSSVRRFLRRRRT